MTIKFRKEWANDHLQWCDDDMVRTTILRAIMRSIAGYMCYSVPTSPVASRPRSLNSTRCTRTNK